MSVLRRLATDRDAGIILSALLLVLVFSLSSEGFFSAYNLFNVSRTIAFSALVALSQAVVLVAGGMNLSVGAIGGLATITTGYCIQVLGWPGWLAATAALAVGAAAGLLNGLIITRLNINSFITTLATLFVFTGLVNGFSEGYAYTDIPREFTFLGRQKLFGFSNLFWVLALVLALVYYGFQHTVLGRRLLATGGNLQAAQMSGIDTKRMILYSHLLSGVLAGLAAVLWVSRMGSAQPATGKDWLITSFSVAIVGGTGLAGGSISALGILMGAIIIVLIKNGLVMLEANVYYEQAFLGSIILLAVVVSRLREIYSARLKK
ncbi:MAG: ribose transport system permease protein [Candidatus Latescibacterota bacterium]